MNARTQLLALLLSTVAMACSGAEAGAPGEGNAAISSVSGGSAVGIETSSKVSLKNGADRTLDNGPDTVFVSVPVARAKNPEIKVTNQANATCTTEIDERRSNTKRTVFKISVDYALEDGANLCDFQLTGPSYSAKLEVSLLIDT